MQPQPEELHVLPHFKPEEVEALRVEHDRRVELLKGHGSFTLDEERVRDAIQREAFWRAQPVNEHTNEELGHALFQQGRISEALMLAKSPERRAYYEGIQIAILKDDAEGCDCEIPEHVVGQFPSAKHGGKLTNIYQCPQCKTMNVK